MKNWWYQAEVSKILGVWKIKNLLKLDIMYYIPAKCDVSSLSVADFTVGGGWQFCQPSYLRLRSKKPSQNRVDKKIRYDSTFIYNTSYLSCKMCFVCLQKFELREAAREMKDIVYRRLLLTEHVFYYIATATKSAN